MLSKEIQEFIEMIRLMQQKNPAHACGGLLVPKAAKEKLVAALEGASEIIGSREKEGRVTYHPVDSKTDLTLIPNPSILILVQEDYHANPEWAEKIREKAAYFLSVAG